jgi:hypothetical protein
VYEPESYATWDVVLVATNTNTKHLRRVAEEEKEEAAIPKCKRSHRSWRCSMECNKKKKKNKKDF